MVSDGSMDEKIIELRKAGLGYKAIAGEVGVKRDKVRYVCLKHGLGGTIASNSPEEREKRFKKAFEEKFPEFEYHSGFVNTDSKFKCKCKTCGTIAVKNAQCVKPSRNKKLQCDNCIERERLKRINKPKKPRKKAEFGEGVCKECGKVFLRRSGNQKWCSEECYNKAHGIGQVIIKRCLECGKEFKTYHNGNLFCGKKCRKRRNRRMWAISKDERLRKNGKADYSITLDKLVKRDMGVCQLCGKPVDTEDYQQDADGNFIAGNKYPSIDHILPISRGGVHTWDNVQLAHRYCNSLKQDQMLSLLGVCL